MNAHPAEAVGPEHNTKTLEIAMSMRTVSDPRAAPQNLAGQFWVRGVIDPLKRWLMAYKKWTAERTACAQLHAMTDRELKDIGVTRTDVNYAVRRNAARYGVYSRDY